LRSTDKGNAGVDFNAKHRETVLKLHRQRNRMLKTGMGDSALLQKIERRLRVALAGINLPQDDEQKPTDASSGFLTYAARIVNEYDTAKLATIYEEGLALLEEGDDVAEGVFDALSLYPQENVDWMLSRYKEHSNERVNLFRLWQSQCAELPTGLINQAELQSLDAALQERALNFAANSPHYGREIFSSYYQNMKAAISSSLLAESVLSPAIWGGLVRGDSEAYNVLRHAVERVSDLEVRHDLLRMLALSGMEDDLPVLLTYAERNPERGYPLLALYGRPSVVMPILQGMERANSLKPAYSAWLMLTNLSLPMRPRLMLVEQYEKPDQADAEPDEIELIPDVSIARKWWDTQQPHWPLSERRYAGFNLTRENLVQAVSERIGVAADDLMALLALELQQPLAIGQSWECQRQEKIQKLLARQKSDPSHQREVC
jgi:hypothetical protein